MDNAKARLVTRERIILTMSTFAEIVVWELPSPVPGSGHPWKYRLALVVDQVCVLRYDNEAGKGDHRHSGGSETPYRFDSLDKLLADFRLDIQRVLG